MVEYVSLGLRGDAWAGSLLCVDEKWEGRSCLGIYEGEKGCSLRVRQPSQAETQGNVFFPHSTCTLWTNPSGAPPPGRWGSWGVTLLCVLLARDGAMKPLQGVTSSLRQWPSFPCAVRSFKRNKIKSGRCYKGYKEKEYFCGLYGTAAVAIMFLHT